MVASLTLAQVILLSAYAAGMAGGQILFKMAALRVTEGSIDDRLAGLVQNWYFFAAILLYAGLSVLWVWILTFTPLSRAYPFVAMAFVLTPLLGVMVFGEPLDVRLILGLLFVLGGLVLISS
jgi:drug/metabolite transporter (DMT)-like permease